jgi:hypothetical protein
MYDSWQEAAMFNTALIEAVSSSTGTTQWVGTGFFVVWHASEGMFLFLVSNKHVLEANKAIEYVVTLHRKAKKGEGMPLRSGGQEVWIDLLNPIKVKLNSQDAYFQHSSPYIDLACICCSELGDRDDIVLVPFSQNKILDWNNSFLYPGQSISFVGYPDSVRDQMHNLPVMRTGTLASLPCVNFDGQPNFLLDAQVWEGSSGSPVFVKGDPGQPAFSVIGVIHARRQKDDGTDANIGLGYAVKSAELVTLLKETTDQMLASG